MKSLVWIFPDRGSGRQRTLEREHYWHRYEQAAASVDLRLDVVAPEAVDITYRPGDGATVFVNGTVVKPSDTLFVTELYTFPHQHADVLLQITTFCALQRLGFYLPIEPWFSVIANDKLATHVLFRDTAVPVLPSVRLTAGRDLDERRLDVLLGGLAFPLVVKPCSWGAGLGFTVAHDRRDLENTLSLASGSNTTMIVQPCLAGGAVDYRVYVVESEPRWVATRTPAPGDLVANLARGGRAAFVDLPAPLRTPVEAAAARIPLPFFALDFLFDGKAFWLSEIELDPGVPYTIDPDRVHALLQDRFRAYDRAHEQWLAARPVSPSP